MPQSNVLHPLLLVIQFTSSLPFILSIYIIFHFLNTLYNKIKYQYKNQQYYEYILILRYNRVHHFLSNTIHHEIININNAQHTVIDKPIVILSIKFNVVAYLSLLFSSAIETYIFIKLVDCVCIALSVSFKTVDEVGYVEG